MPANNDVYLPKTAKILEFIQEAPNVFSLRLQLIDPDLRRQYSFHPGQFNMVYLYGVGEVAISIVSDSQDPDIFIHTIRAVGRVTRAMNHLQAGQFIGIRGPFGRGWPMKSALGKDIVILTGGLGCAPVMAAIHAIINSRNQYGHLKILQGVKHSSDFIFQQRYHEWFYQPDTQVLVSADHSDGPWPWKTGRITEVIHTLSLTPENTMVLMCGPEIMMHSGTLDFLKKNIDENNIYWSMERNMECGIGHCGHCQYGGLFICKNGPVFSYPEIKELISVAGF